MLRVLLTLPASPDGRSTALVCGASRGYRPGFVLVFTDCWLFKLSDPTITEHGRGWYDALSLKVKTYGNVMAFVCHAFYRRSAQVLVSKRQQWAKFAWINDSGRLQSRFHRLDASMRLVFARSRGVWRLFPGAMAPWRHLPRYVDLYVAGLGCSLRLGKGAWAITVFVWSRCVLIAAKMRFTIRASELQRGLFECEEGFDER